MNIEEQTPIGSYDAILAICTEMFNPDYPVVLDALGTKYILSNPVQFLRDYSNVAKKIIVMEAYPTGREFELSPEQHIRKIAEGVGLEANIGKEELSNGTLFYGVINKRFKNQVDKD